jgi:hypothetical protein
MFNMLTAAQTSRLAVAGVRPAELLDPHARGAVPAGLLAEAQRMIAGGLTWVLAGLLACAIALFAVTKLMPRARKCQHEVTAADTLEAA